MILKLVATLFASKRAYRYAGKHRNHNTRPALGSAVPLPHVPHGGGERLPRVEPAT